jgi:hypothetical protein
MALVGYSPYQDAANFGDGLSQGIAAIAQRLPQLKMQQMQMEAQFKRLPYELALNAAQTHLAQSRGEEAGAHGELYKSQAKAKDQDTDTRKKLNDTSGFPVALGNNPEQMAAAISMLSNLAKGNFAKPVTIPNGGSLATGPTNSLLTAAANIPPGNVRVPPNNNPGEQPVAAPFKPSQSGQLDENTKVNAARGVVSSSNPLMDPSTMSAAENFLRSIFQGQTNAPAIPAAGQPTNDAPVTVNSQEDYDKLPNGALFIDSTGKTKKKGVK